MTLHTKGGHAGAVFLDLTAAYDNIWHAALLYKLSKCLPLRCIQTVELLLQNSHFRAHMENDVSSWQRQANGLPQGSVLHLALTLFNLYTSDLPVTRSRRFIYADDICCALQVETFSEIECTLTADLAKYNQLWRLKPSTSKTVTSVIHLHNNRSCRELNVHMNGQRLKHDPYPVYLGVTLDRTLSYREHLSRSAEKLKSRNNLFAKLAGTSWDLIRSSVATLHNLLYS